MKPGRFRNLTLDQTSNDVLRWSPRHGRKEVTTVMNNQELGKLIGVSYSMASRLQSGDRTPGIDTMRQIANVFDFPIDLQAEARAAGHYHTLFSEAIRRYEVDREPVTAAAVAPDGG